MNAVDLHRLPRTIASAEAHASGPVPASRGAEALLEALIKARREAGTGTASRGRAPTPPSPGQLLERVVDGHLFAEVTRCGRCDDTGILPEVQVDERGYESPAPCPCARLRRVAARLNTARIPADRGIPRSEAWRERFAGDSEAAMRSNAAAFAGVGRLAQSLERLQASDPLPRGLLLSGPPGVGKTFLVGALMRWVASGPAADGLAQRARRAEERLQRLHTGEHLNRGPRVPAVRYWAWPECMQHLFGCMRAGSLDLALDELAAVPLLALDELAAGAPSDFETEKLNQLLVARHRLGTCTVIATNYRLVARSPEDPEYLGNRLGAHTFSRLHLLAALPMAGVDRRPLVEAAR